MTSIQRNPLAISELLEKIFEREKYMSKYEGKFMDRIRPDLPEGEKERVLVVHNECIFYSNDGKGQGWKYATKKKRKRKVNYG